MNTIDRYRDLQEVLERMREEFSQNDEIVLGFYHMSRPGTDDPFHDFITCSGIVSDWPEGIYYELNTRTFFYHGELPPAFGAKKTTFPIVEDLLTVLPEKIKEALVRVGETGVPETYLFHEEEFLLGEGPK